MRLLPIPLFYHQTRLRGLRLAVASTAARLRSGELRRSEGGGGETRTHKPLRAPVFKTGGITIIRPLLLIELYNEIQSRRRCRHL